MYAEATQPGRDQEIHRSKTFAPQGYNNLPYTDTATGKSLFSTAIKKWTGQLSFLFCAWPIVDYCG